MDGTTTFLEDPATVRAALSPLRRSILESLAAPGSAAAVARRLSVPRQRIGYHLRALEQAGLVELQEERQSRGLVERVFRRSADALVVDPGVIGLASADEQDAEASTRVIHLGMEMATAVARMKQASDVRGLRLLTFTVEATVHLGEPGDVERLAGALADAIEDVASNFDTAGGRPHRIALASFPSPKSST